MSMETMIAVLGWCSIINIGILFFWALMITVGHDWIYKIHSKWFKLSVESFDKIHYAGIAFFKMAVFVLNIVPYFALRIVLSN